MLRDRSRRCKSSLRDRTRACKRSLRVRTLTLPVFDKNAIEIVVCGLYSHNQRWLAVANAIYGNNSAAAGDWKSEIENQLLDAEKGRPAI